MQQQSKIIRYVLALSQRDRERFHQFVSSPYFNQHEKTQELLEIILANAEQEKNVPEREALFEQLFPGQAYDEQRLHNVMSYLKRLYHRFLAQQFFEAQPLREQLSTLEAAYESNQFEVMTNRARLLEKTITQYPYQNGDYHFVSYRFNFLVGYYSGGFVDRSKTETFQKMLDHLDRYFLIEKLRHCCHLTANMMQFNTNYNFGFLEQLLSYIQEQPEHFETEIPIKLYYTILMSLRDEQNPTYYEQMKHILRYHMHQLTKEEGSDLYKFANNYCIRQINLGNRKYQRELFELYQEGLKTELLLSNGLISEFDYKNITTLGCSLKEFVWTEQFLQEYREKLPPQRRENAYNFNLANLYYNKKMYNEALEALRDVQFTDVVYHLNTTFLQLRTYYALHDTEALLSLIETFRIYVIRNKKLTSTEKKGYTNMLRFARSLVSIQHHADTFSKKALTEKLGALRQKIEATQNVINKQWLLEECQA